LRDGEVNDQYPSNKRYSGHDVNSLEEVSEEAENSINYDDHSDLNDAHAMLDSNNNLITDLSDDAKK